MTSNAAIIENLLTNRGETSTNIKLNELYATYQNNARISHLTRSPSITSVDSFSSPSSSSTSTKQNSDLPIAKSNTHSILSSNQRKETTLKIPYPVLSDHRDPSSILVLLEKENQTTSKKIVHVIKEIATCEESLTMNSYNDNEKKTMKCERVKLKQQLDTLKKHERRVNLQIDFVTTKTEIQGLEEKQKQIEIDQKSDERQQIKILLSKLKQQSDKMKIYMRTRNDQMKKIINNKSKSNNDCKPYLLPSRPKHLPMSSTTQMNRKRAPTLPNSGPANKRSKPTGSNVRLASRTISDDLKTNSTPQPVVRFVNKTTESRNNSASPTTPTSSSSTLSSRLVPTTSLTSVNTYFDPRQREERTSVDNDDDNNDLDLDLDIDKLFNDDSCSQSKVSRLRTEKNDTTHTIQMRQHT